MQPTNHPQAAPKQARNFISEANHPIFGNIVSGIYYKHPDYWIEIEGKYEQMRREDVRALVKERYAQHFEQPPFGDRLNMLLASIAMHRSIHYVLPKLPGYRVGLHIINDTKVLVPEALELMEPGAGSCEMINQILLGMLGPLQFDFTMAWLQISYGCLKANVCMPGQVLILAGPKSCGKNLLQEQIITPILGNRIAEPYRYIVDKTSFNPDHFKACHLMISDQKNPTNRLNVQEFVRRIASNDFDSLHPKGKEAVTLNILWRMTISCNEEEKDLRIIPPLDGLDDKLFLFKCEWHDMPMPTETGMEREAFRAAIQAELPAFLAQVLSFKIPDELRSQRFGVKGYMHPELQRKVQELESEVELLELIRDYHEADPGFDLEDITSAKLHETLHARENLRDQLRRIALSPRTLGKLLGKLAERNNGTVTGRLRQGTQLWTINI